MLVSEGQNTTSVANNFLGDALAMFTSLGNTLEWKHVPALSYSSVGVWGTLVCMDEAIRNKAVALTEAYDEFADAIYRHCYFRVFQKERAEELVQETFVKTWQYLVNGQSVNNLRAFLYRVANNLIVDESRRKKETSLEALQDQGVEFGYRDDDRLRTNIDAGNVIEFLQTLDAGHRDLIIMRYIDGLEPEEIAEITGETANVISVRLHRAIKKVREQFPYDEIT
jgi:RNA polymerase sigma-70 factor (ECF subfamily)